MTLISQSLKRLMQILTIRFVVGMFLTVHVNLPVRKDSIVIPRNAISYSLFSQSAFTLEPKIKDGQPVEASYTSIEWRYENSQYR